MESIDEIISRWEELAGEWEERSREFESKGELRLSGHYHGAAKASRSHARQIREALGPNAKVRDAGTLANETGKANPGIR